ncbi:hypothetical protein A6R68_13195 [Neotoma lepida]|uniref:Leucine-rich repeat-containing protein 3 n=1 Tax=Neotoma lepida TaxID=56216 RepID=A0A1A6H1S4_NEOLE|nr:hypothetical protein A6R68_13195 [Neotoma lepida]
MESRPQPCALLLSLLSLCSTPLSSTGRWVGAGRVTAAAGRALARLREARKAQNSHGRSELRPLGSSAGEDAEFVLDDCLQRGEGPPANPSREEPPGSGGGKMGPRGRQSPSSPLAPSQGSCFFILFCLRLGASCPQACQCPDHAGAVAVHCSSKGLQEIPRDIPADTVLLKLDANRISRVPNGAFQNLPQLRELDLSHNAIEAIGPAAFSGLAGGLRLLDLSHNRIRRIPKDALGKLSAKIRLSHNPLHCECALQEALWELKLDPDSVDEIACHTSAQEQFVGKPLIQVLDSGASFCSTHRKTTDVAMLVTMFCWFTMVIAYVVYYVRHNQEDARRHLEYLKSLPSGDVLELDKGLSCDIQLVDDRAEDIGVILCLHLHVVTVTVGHRKEDPLANVEDLPVCSTEGLE